MPRGAERPRRTVRVEDTVWEQAIEVAKSRGDSLPELIRQFLQRYVKKNGSK